MPTDPLAISTGIGQGEAQVFDIPKSTFYRDKLNEAKKADADIASDVSTTLSKAPWSNDLPEFREMQSNIRNYVKNNRAALVKGDFDAKIELERMKQEYLNRYEESKSAEKFYDKMSNFYLSHPNSYYKGDYDRMQELALKGSKHFGPATVRLRKNFSAQQFNDNLTAKVKSIPETFQGAYLQDIKDDETGKSYTYLVTKDGDTKTKLRDVAGAVYDAWAKDYTEEQMIAKDVTREAAEDYAENFLKSKFKYSQPYDAEERKSKSGLESVTPDALSNPSKSKYKTGSIYQFNADSGTYSIGSLKDDIEGYRIAANTSASNVGSTEGARVIDLTKEVILDVPGQGKKTFKPGSDFTDAEIKVLNDYVASKLSQESSKASAYEVGFFSSKSASGSPNTTYIPVKLNDQKFEPVIGVSVIRTGDGFSSRVPMTASDVSAERTEATTKAKAQEYIQRMYDVYYSLQDQKKEVEKSSLPEDKKQAYYKQVDDILNGLQFNDEELKIFKEKYSGNSSNPQGKKVPSSTVKKTEKKKLSTVKK